MSQTNQIANSVRRASARLTEFARLTVMLSTSYQTKNYASRKPCDSINEQRRLDAAQRAAIVLSGEGSGEASEAESWGDSKALQNSRSTAPGGRYVKSLIRLL